MGFQEIMEAVGLAIDVTGVAVIAVGVVVSLWLFGLHALRKRDVFQAWTRSRQVLARSILLGLEFLVAGDIVRTVAITATFASVGVLGLIVLIRTFLSLALEVETEGRWPWQRGTST